ncbi:hypothetical protein L249_0479 [Ophiocordyceps polyrhachis-furcata BCC 54312]|uniref:Uncharacterized protein n=1 Tax=Ophiocordyceps polyrhachis-furcata BCC 54312 TaxID=1330021 RepID=A0A367LD63_9HYPO|nr:hypothetical protein L249_0479 [Ophiocordyceps polyrhachis-furcata BCC 54312]
MSSTAKGHVNAMILRWGFLRSQTDLEETMILVPFPWTRHWTWIWVVVSRRLSRRVDHLITVLAAGGVDRIYRPLSKLISRKTTITLQPSGAGRNRDAKTTAGAQEGRPLTQGPTLEIDSSEEDEVFRGDASSLEPGEPGEPRWVVVPDLVNYSDWEDPWVWTEARGPVRVVTGPVYLVFLIIGTTSNYLVLPWFWDVFSIDVIGQEVGGYCIKY